MFLHTFKWPRQRGRMAIVFLRNLWSFKRNKINEAPTFYLHCLCKFDGICFKSFFTIFIFHLQTKLAFNKAYLDGHLKPVPHWKWIVYDSNKRHSSLNWLPLHCIQFQCSQWLCFYMKSPFRGNSIACQPDNQLHGCVYVCVCMCSRAQL